MCQAFRSSGHNRHSNYLDIDGETKTRNIQARLKKGALPKYLPNCPTYFNDNSIKQQRLDRDKRETELQMQVYT